MFYVQALKSYEDLLEVLVCQNTCRRAFSTQIRA